MPDLQGSVRYTTDDGANASPTVNYDPYGTPEGGVVPPTFGYDGELQDAATGLQNLRARTYNPATGQFLTRDPLEQQTGQAYLYASGDPVNGSDPSGACYIPNTHRDAALPGVPPDDQNCAISTVDDALSRILSTNKSPIYYPTEADKTCLYQEILRDIPGARSALPKGFYVSPARQVRTVIHRGGSVFDRAFTGVVAIGDGALSVAEDAAQAVAAAENIVGSAGQTIGRAVGPEEFVGASAGIVGAVATGFIAGIVTQPTLRDGDLANPQTLLQDLEATTYRRFRRDIPTVCFSLGLGIRLPECSSLGPRDANPQGIVVPAIALHILEAQIIDLPSTLTYFGADERRRRRNRNRTCGKPGSARARRVNQMLGITSGSNLACDEYPFASTDQGGDPDNVSLTAVPGDQNDKQGFILSDFYRVNFAGYTRPGPFNVRVVP